MKKIWLLAFLIVFSSCSMRSDNAGTTEKKEISKEEEAGDATDTDGSGSNTEDHTGIESSSGTDSETVGELTREDEVVSPAEKEAPFDEENLVDVTAAMACVAQETQVKMDELKDDQEKLQEYFLGVQEKTKTILEDHGYINEQQLSAEYKKVSDVTAFTEKVVASAFQKCNLSEEFLGDNSPPQSEEAADPALPE